MRVIDPEPTNDSEPRTTVDTPTVFGLALDDRLSPWLLDADTVTAVAGDVVDRYRAAHPLYRPSIKASFGRGGRTGRSSTPSA
ncbi:hypothetical protein JNUCC0626_04545 [Lentzea sp. JNUCC 0626]|uniref:hypothetical protein n=1 Tax=Lentzea sp. JNUCC 0626 TaxID=3367513 RepID=UPI0037498E72